MIAAGSKNQSPRLPAGPFKPQGAMAAARWTLAAIRVPSGAPTRPRVRPPFGQTSARLRADAREIHSLGRMTGTASSALEAELR